MNERKLNEKLAKWAGFTNIEFLDTCILANPPEGREDEEFTLDFTNSLDACFKWLVPKLREKSKGVTIYCWDSLTTVKIGDVTIQDKDPALALCLAIEKLIDIELAGKEVLKLKGEKHEYERDV